MGLYMPHVFLFSRRPKEGVGSPGAGAQVVVNCLTGCWEHRRSSARAGNALNCRHSSSSGGVFFFF